MSHDQLDDGPDTADGFGDLLEESFPDAAESGPNSSTTTAETHDQPSESLVAGADEPSAPAESGPGAVSSERQSNPSTEVAAHEEYESQIGAQLGGLENAANGYTPTSYDESGTRSLPARLVRHARLMVGLGDEYGSYLWRDVALAWLQTLAVVLLAMAAGEVALSFLGVDSGPLARLDAAATRAVGTVLSAAGELAVVLRANDLLALAVGLLLVLALRTYRRY